MKKISLSVVLLLVVLVASIQINGFTNNNIDNNVMAQTTKGVGNTFAEIFPDPILAQGLADQIASGSVNDVLTQEMVDNTMFFSMTGNSIQDITGIGVLNQLVRITLNSNQIQFLPDDIGNLTNLQVLNMDFNQVSNIPDSFGNLVNLQTIHLGNNRITTIPDSFASLRSLQTLSFGNSLITELPSNFGNLSNLSILELRGNKLSTLPASFMNLNRLTWLNLSNNQFTSLPDNIGDLTSLQGFYVESNQLTSLPVSMGNLSQLSSSSFLDNLLPTDYNAVLNSISPMFFNYQTQRQLMFDQTTLQYPINNQADFDNIDVISLLRVSSNTTPIFPSHTLRVEDYLDGSGNVVNISDYIVGGKVVKNGSVFINVRALGNGLYPNNSDHALTSNSLELVFAIEEFTLSFNVNGGSSATPAAQTIIEGQTGTAVADPIRDGYVFKGWNTAIDGSGTNWIVGTTPMVASNTTLYAQWEVSTYTLSFDVNGGNSTIPASQDISAGQTGIAVADPIRDGYVFKGWNTAIDGSGTNWIVGTTPMQASNTTLYAQWELASNNNTGTDTGSLPMTGSISYFLVALVLIVIALVIRQVKFNKNQR